MAEVTKACRALNVRGNRLSTLQNNAAKEDHEASQFASSARSLSSKHEDSPPPDYDQSWTEICCSCCEFGADDDSEDDYEKMSGTTPREETDPPTQLPSLTVNGKKT